MVNILTILGSSFVFVLVNSAFSTENNTLKIGKEKLAVVA